MGYLEDLIMGLMGGGGQQQYRPLSPFSTASPEKEEEMRRYFAEHGLLGGMADEIAAKDVIGLSDTEIAGYQSGMTNIPTRADAQARFAEADAAIPAEPEEPAEEKMKRLQQETNQRSLDALTGGSGPDSGVSYPAGLLMAIRKQAALKGQAGSLGADVSADVTLDDYLQPNVGAGGSFSQGANTPELQARLRERDEWTAGQPMRDLEFAMTPEQTRRNPAYAKSAGETLTGLKEQQAIGRRQQIQELFVNKLAGSGGTIPRDKAAQLQALGVDVPYGATGSSVDEGAAFFDDAISKAGTFLAQLDQVDATSGHPMIKVQKYGAMLAEKYKQLVAAGQINPDDAIKQWKSEIAQLALSQGLINTQESASMTQQ